MRLAVLLALALFPLTARAGLPEEDGPYTALSEVDTIAAGPAQVKATVCLPANAPGARPLMALATSVTEPRDVLTGLCLHYATYGFIAVVPDLGYANTDAASIGQTLLDALAFLEREDTRDGSRFEGKVDPLHRGVLGFNTGAMGALQAAAQDDTLSVAVLLDPLDINGQARAAAANVQHVPVMLVVADPSQCNANGGSPAIYAELHAPRSTVHVIYATDCDAEWPASQNCQLACGNSHEYAFKYVRRFATAYAGLFVGCLDTMRGHVSGSALDELVAGRLVDHVDQQDLPSACGPFVAVDAGAPSVDAGPPQGSGCASSDGSTFAILALLSVALALKLGRRAWGRLAVFALLLTVARPARADSDREVEVSAGVGFSDPDQPAAGEGIGAFGQAEYVAVVSSWFQPRLYAGLLITGAKHDCGAQVNPCSVDAQIVETGGKLRFTAPIPWVAPFLELGAGLSVGHLETRLGKLANVDHFGVAFNLPFALGVALGPEHEFEVSLEYLFHPAQAQFETDVGIGLRFPLPEGRDTHVISSMSDDAPPAEAPPPVERHPTTPIPGSCTSDHDCKQGQHCYTGVGTEGLCMDNAQ